MNSLNLNRLLTDIYVHIEQLQECRERLIVTGNRSAVDKFTKAIEELTEISESLLLKGTRPIDKLTKFELNKKNKDMLLPNSMNNFRAVVRMKHLNHNPKELINIAKEKGLDKKNAISIIKNMNDKERESLINLFTNSISAEVIPWMSQNKISYSKSYYNIHEKINELMTTRANLLKEDQTFRDEIRERVLNYIKSRPYSN